MTRTLRLAIAVAAASGMATTPATASAQQAEPARLTLVDQTFALEAGGTWRAELTLDAALADAVVPTTTTTTTTSTPTTTSTTAPPADVDEPVADDAEAATVRIAALRPVDTRVELAEVLAGERATVVAAVEQPLDASPGADGTASLAVEVPTATENTAPGNLVLRRPGLYPISIEVVVDGEVVAGHRTFLERLPLTPIPAESMNVAIVAGVADPGPDPSADEVAAGRDGLAAIAATAEAVDGPITVSLPPVLLDGLADDDAALSAELRAALVGDEVLAAPADVLDPSSAVAIDAQAAFTRELLDGDDILSAALPDSPPLRSAWPAPTPISTGAATMLRNLGFRSLVFTPEIYNGLEGSIGGFLDTTLSVDVDLGEGVMFPAMVLDRNGELLDPAVVDADTSATDAAVQVMASLVTTRREFGADLRRSVILATPAGTVPDPDIAAALAGFVATTPDFELASLSALPSVTDTMMIPDEGPEVVTLPDTAGPDLSTRARRIELARVSAEASGSMLLDDARLLEWRAELDSLLSTALDDAEVDEVLVRIAAETESVRAQVELPRPFTFTLTGRSSPLRLNLRNNADEPLQVVVSPRSPKLTFPSGDQLVRLEPGGVTEVVIPVESRTNGTSSLEIAVLTPVFAVEIDPPVVLTARVNALTGLGQVVTGGAILVLVTWWYGHFRRRRRSRLALAGDLDGFENGNGIGRMSPDAAEATVVPPAGAGQEPPAGSVLDP